MDIFLDIYTRLMISFLILMLIGLCMGIYKSYLHDVSDKSTGRIFTYFMWFLLLTGPAMAIIKGIYSAWI